MGTVAAAIATVATLTAAWIHHEQTFKGLKEPFSDRHPRFAAIFFKNISLVSPGLILGYRDHDQIDKKNTTYLLSLVLRTLMYAEYQEQAMMVGLTIDTISSLCNILCFRFNKDSRTNQKLFEYCRHCCWLWNCWTKMSIVKRLLPRIH